MPTYVGSNTQFLSIPMIQFNLRGQGNSCKVEVEPSYCQFEGDTYINHDYSQVLKLKKRSEGQVKYWLRLEGKNKESFEVDILTQGKSMSKGNGVIDGTIDANSEGIDLKINVRSAERGECMAYFYIEIEDGAPISFQVVCNFMGPMIKCLDPITDYGLVKVNSEETCEIEIENTSPIAAEVLIKNSQNHRLNFNNMVSMDYIKARQVQDSSSASLIFDKPLPTTNGNNIIFDQHHITLKPKEKVSVLISLKSIKPERVEEHFEIMTKDGESQYFQVLAHV